MSSRPSEAVSAASILQEAASIVDGARQETHGPRERSFAAIAHVWNAYLDVRPGGRAAPATPADVSVLMLLLKVCRSAQGKALRDHWVDACGYAALAGELALRQVREE